MDPTAAPAQHRPRRLVDIGWLLLLAALADLVVEAIIALESGTYRMIPVGEQWFKLHVASLNLVQALVQRYIHPALWDPILVTVLQWPLWSLLGAPGAVLVAFERLGDAHPQEARLGAAGNRRHAGGTLPRPAPPACGPWRGRPYSRRAGAVAVGRPGHKRRAAGGSVAPGWRECRPGADAGAADPRYAVDRPLTREADATAFNNFYEFGSHKAIAPAAQALRLRPWQVRIDGLVETDMTIGIDELLARLPLEERIYRHCCVEAWSMVVPGPKSRCARSWSLPSRWRARAMSRWRRLRIRAVAPGQRQAWYP